MSDQKKIQLKVVGLSYSQNQSNAYALILGEIDGPVRIPIVIGAAEAQSIAMMIEGINTPRPMTHDLYTSTIRAFDIEVEEVFIYKFEDGIFSSEITLNNSLRQVTIDCRTSDAVAVAMRTGAPITTTRAILEATGFVMENDPTVSEVATDEATETDPQDLSVERLQQMLDEAIALENYEEAGRLSEIIKKKKS